MSCTYVINSDLVKSIVIFFLESDMQHCYEMMGFTWRAKSSKQQDAILIAETVFQDDLGITALHQFTELDSWCVAVADGVSSSPRSEKAAVTVLESVKTQSIEYPNTDIDFQEIQHNLCLQLADNPKTTSASSTLALVRSTPSKGHLRIQSLGDSRVYIYCSFYREWSCLTIDHTFLEELRHRGEIDSRQQYASIYNGLTSCFCADWLNEVANSPPQRALLLTNNALLICTDGVHDVLNCRCWPGFDKEVTHKEWLTSMKKLLSQPDINAYDNVSMVLLRLI